MPCSDRVRLEKKHYAARAKFDAAMQCLHERIGISPQPEYMTLLQRMDLAFQELHYVRTMLDEHIRQHCCLSEGETAT